MHGFLLDPTGQPSRQMSPCPHDALREEPGEGPKVPRRHCRGTRNVPAGSIASRHIGEDWYQAVRIRTRWMTPRTTSTSSTPAATKHTMAAIPAIVPMVDQ